jgi:putative acetyltransferase
VGNLRGLARGVAWDGRGDGVCGADMCVAIERLSEGQVQAAKGVIAAGCREFFGEEPADFRDMEKVSVEYREPWGTFLVLLDGECVVGTGAIRRLDEETCELKRMWFLPAYRGKGWGTRMAELLLAFARGAGYKRVRLDTSPLLAAANRLYARLGFQAIERYNCGPCTVFMEKRL